MSPKIDLYGLEAKHASLRTKLEEALKSAQNGFVELFNQRSRSSEPISARNTQILLDFDTAAGLEGLGKCRRLKYLLVGLQFAKRIQKDLDKLVLDDIQRLVLWVDERANPWTRQMHKVILKKLVKYVSNPDGYLLSKEYPENVRWIKVNVKKKDMPKVERDQLLTEEEILRGIQAAESQRDKAMFALQTETGCRVGELANLRIKDVISEQLKSDNTEREYFIRLNGKTGERTVIIFYSVPYLLDWLNHHPQKDNPESPLWTLQLKSQVRPVNYAVIRKVVQQIYKRAGINKLPRTHYLRHSRVTLDSKQGISESIAKRRFGWVNDTRQIATYSHLVDEDVNNHYRARYGKAGKEAIQPVITVKPCHKCTFVNPITNDFCSKCQAIISAAAAERLKTAQEQKVSEMETRLQQMEKLLGAVTQQLQQPVSGTIDGINFAASSSGLTLNGAFKPIEPRKEKEKGAGTWVEL